MVCDCFSRVAPQVLGLACSKNSGWLQDSEVKLCAVRQCRFVIGYELGFCTAKRC